ncbi:hypothetical protein HYV84_02225 [Candidatus Woesearchaeota archaeon]|nr:hypothetical protein [Candidatus Woesearchaeota archaeon]
MIANPASQMEEVTQDPQGDPGAQDPQGGQPPDGQGQDDGFIPPPPEIIPVDGGFDENPAGGLGPPAGGPCTTQNIIGFGDSLPDPPSDAKCEDMDLFTPLPGSGFFMVAKSGDYVCKEENKGKGKPYCYAIRLIGGTRRIFLCDCMAVSGRSSNGYQTPGIKAACCEKEVKPEFALKDSSCSKAISKANPLRMPVASCCKQAPSKDSLCSSMALFGQPGSAKTGDEACNVLPGGKCISTAFADGRIADCKYPHTKTAQVTCCYGTSIFPENPPTGLGLDPQGNPIQGFPAGGLTQDQAPIPSVVMCYKKAGILGTLQSGNEMCIPEGTACTSAVTKKGESISCQQYSADILSAICCWPPMIKGRACETKGVRNGETGNSVCANRGSACVSTDDPIEPKPIDVANLDGGSGGQAGGGPCDTSFKANQFHVCYFDGISPKKDSSTSLFQKDYEPFASPVGTASGFLHPFGKGEIAGTKKSDKVSGIWRSEVSFLPGEYTFTTSSDDGVRLSIEGIGAVINNFKIHSETQDTSTRIPLRAPSPQPQSEVKKKITLEWFESEGGATISLSWVRFPLDFDDDGISDGQDSDRDGDGIPNNQDPTPDGKNGFSEGKIKAWLKGMIKAQEVFLEVILHP